MYDMSGFDYDIRDVVRILNLTVRRKNPRSYDVDCPFCNYKRGKLNVNTVKNVFRCNYCNEQGGMLDMYSKLYNITKSEANRQIREALGHYADIGILPHMPIFEKCRQTFIDIPMPSAFFSDMGNQYRHLF